MRFEDIDVGSAMEIDPDHTNVPETTPHHWAVTAVKRLKTPIPMKGKLKITAIQDPAIIETLNNEDSFCRDDEKAEGEIEVESGAKLTAAEEMSNLPTKTEEREDYDEAELIVGVDNQSEPMDIDTSPNKAKVPDLEPMDIDTEPVNARVADEHVEDSQQEDEWSQTETHEVEPNQKCESTNIFATENMDGCNDPEEENPIKSPAHRQLSQSPEPSDNDDLQLNSSGEEDDESNAEQGDARDLDSEDDEDEELDEVEDDPWTCQNCHVVQFNDEDESTTWLPYVLQPG